MKICSQCRTPSPDSARTCPQCGTPLPAAVRPPRPRPWGALILGGGIAGIVLLCLLLVVLDNFNFVPSALFAPAPRVTPAHPRPTPTAAPTLPPAPTAPRQPGDCTTQAGYFAAVSREIFDQAVSFQAQNDSVALQQLYDQQVIFQLRAGVRVALVRTAFAMVEVRPVGGLNSVWTFTEAVDCRR